MFSPLKPLESSLHRRALILLVLFLFSPPPALADEALQIDPRQESLFAGFSLANNDSWEKFGRIRRGEETAPVGAEKDVESPTKIVSSARQVQQTPASLAPSEQQALSATPATPSRPIDAKHGTVAQRLNYRDTEGAPTDPNEISAVQIPTSPYGKPVGYSIVYTSSPRNATSNVAGAYPGQYPGIDLGKVASEVAAINSGFEETDLEMKHPDGTVIENIGNHNCTSSSVIVCAAQEGRVSPDGKRIAYSVSYGTKTNDATMEVTSAHLYIYDIATNTSKVIPNQGPTVISRMPDWLSNTQLVYASNAANKYPVKQQFNCHRGVYPAGHPSAGQKRGYNDGVCLSDPATGNAGKAMQIWKMNIDGSGQVNLTPHEYQAIRPTVLKYQKGKNNTGRIVFSSWQNAEDKGFYQGSAGPGTTTNLWWLMSMDTNGGDQMSLLGAHHSPVINKFLNTGSVAFGLDQLMAVRSVGEDSLGRIYFTNYYRGNHFGLGNTYRFTVQDFHVEGCRSQTCNDYSSDHWSNELPGSGQFLPEDLFSIAPFGVGSDNTQYRDIHGRSTGKLGFMANLSSAPGHMLATWGQGWCYNQLLTDFSTEASDPNSPLYNLPYLAENIAQYLGGQPVCDRQIVEVLVSRVNNPFDPTQMKVIAGNPNKHEWDAQEISMVAGPTPTLTPPLTGNTCHLEVVDMRKAEFYPGGGGEWRDQRFAAQVGVQGNVVKITDPDYYRKNVRSLAIYGIALWDIDHRDPAYASTINYHGFKDKWLIGTMPMATDANGETDGSVKMQIPCNQPFQMSALDAEGTVIAHDTTLHSLRSGEARTCKGCHEGHSIEQDATYTKTTKELFAQTLSAKMHPPLINGTARVTWPEVASIVSSPNRCAGCHSGFQNDSLLWSRVAADQEQLDFPWMKRKLNPNQNYSLPRPYFSGLVARHPRWSPLYWGCVNHRADGYTNDTFTYKGDSPTNGEDNDRDFYEPAGGHLAAVRAAGKEPTAAECKKVAGWIQLGAPNI